MSDHDKLLIEELEKRLLWYREEASADEFDADEVDAICTMLLKLSPESKPRRTTEEAYQNIMRQISLEGENPEGKEAEKADGERAAADGSVEESAGDGSGKESGKAGTDEKKLYGNLRFFRKKKAMMRAAVIVIVAAGIFASLNTVTYARENKSLFTIILERVGWLQIEKEQGEEGLIARTDNIEEIFYDSWGDLDLEVKERITVPVYIPEGYSLYGVRWWSGKNEKIIRSNYYDQGNGHLLFEITLWEENADHYKEALMDETICKLLSEYSDKNTFYYEYEDEYICLASGEKSFYRIEGNILLEEMIKIREGLGDIR